MERPARAAARASEHQKIRQALRQTAPSPGHRPAAVRTGHKLWLIGYAVAFLALTGVAYALDWRAFGLPARTRTTLHAWVLAAQIGTLVLLAAEAVLAFGVARVEDRVSRYVLRRVTRLAALVVIVAVFIVVVLHGWYTGLVTLGVGSAIIGFALQTPLGSLLGWMYLIVKQPYRIGDRIQLGNATGDVIAISYLDTTLWEFGGPHLSTDHPSGRIIKFPNALVLQQPVYNYSWPVFPYIWDEAYVQVAYTADLPFVSEVMQRVADDALGEAMCERIRRYRDLLARTPVDTLSVQERPTVYFRVSQNTWVEAVCRYLVEPRRAGHVKAQIIREAIVALNQAPERVKFPKGDSR